MSVKDHICRWADGRPPEGFGEKALSAALRAASVGYAMGAGARSAAFNLGLTRSRGVDCPVISFGNLTVGGTGKTPMVMEAARILSEAGRRVAVVSRGYGRTDASEAVVVSDGNEILASLERSGDEPMMMARGLPGVAVAVGARRREAAQLVLRECGCDAILLDDGFQHRALARDCDIVLWDTLRPAESMAMLPRGLMRESLGALRRAHALVFTRCNLGRETRKILGRIKRIAPQLTVFHSSLEPAGSIAIGSGETEKSTGETSAGISLDCLKDEPVGAFCGLGNPESFWRIIESAGARLVQRHAFPDHHRPDARELELFLAAASLAGATRVLVTEKDAENLPAGWEPSLAVLALKVRVSFGEEAGRYRDFLLRALG